MKFDSTTACVLMATFFPPLVFTIAVTWHRNKRNRIAKLPRMEKLLRPPGYSLSVRLETAFDSILNCLLGASACSAISGASAVMIAVACDSKASTVVIGPG